MVARSKNLLFSLFTNTGCTKKMSYGNFQPKSVPDVQLNRCFGIRMIKMVSIQNLKCLKHVDMWNEQCSLSRMHINSIQWSALNTISILFWEPPPVWIDFESDNGYQRWCTLIRSPNIWVETWNRMKIKGNTLTWAWCCFSSLRCFSSIQPDIVSWCPWF